MSFTRFDGFLEEASKFTHELRCYDDALAFNAVKQDAERRRTVIEQRYLDGGGIERMNKLLKVLLYPYQSVGWRNSIPSLNLQMEEV